eukprot:10905877-Alexandrium_andersonii.AAC.1
MPPAFRASDVIRPRLPEESDLPATEALAAALQAYWQPHKGLPARLERLARSYPDAAWESWCAHVERSLISAGVVERPAERHL